MNRRCLGLARLLLFNGTMLDTQRTVADLVLDHPECANVLHRHRIDYCCRGDMSIAAASQKAGVEMPALLAELERTIADRTAVDVEDARALPTDGLIAHIVSRHHTYLRKALPFLQALAGKVSRVHGNHEPRLREIDLLVNELADTLIPHLDAEEQTLFPSLVAGDVDRDLVAGELTAMQAEHLAVADLLDRIRARTESIGVPSWACNSYRTLFSELAQLESDIHRHVHLENHVLLPRFIRPPEPERKNGGSKSKRGDQ